MVAMMKTSNRWLGVLGAVAVMISTDVLASSSSSSSSYSQECIPGFYADGDCDDRNNNELCDYDGGDCCACTCEDTQAFNCGESRGFACIDPDAPCVDDDDITSDQVRNCGSVAGFGNSYCDAENNNALCGYDGGDCCECTCDLSGAGAGDDDACQSGFACVDPSASCVGDDDITVDMLVNCDYVVSLGNGYCDPDMNIPECNYDGGDCCECTCEVSEFAGDDESDGRFAGCKAFACIDPDATCVDEDLITTEIIENCDFVLRIGNGFCDSENNNELCAYDGGDCCSCTCEYEYDDDYACTADGSGFDCKDPSAPCIGEERTKDDDDFSVSSDDDFIVSSDDDAMSFAFVPWEQEGPLPTIDGAVEVGTKTEVGVTATAHDVRSGASSVEIGCGEAGGNGCAPANSRDGIASETKSRWSCASKVVEERGPCQIVYTFAETQDIVDILVAFWKGNERIRTLEVHLDGVLALTHESYAGSTFNTLRLPGFNVSTVMLESVDLQPEEWISLIEVMIFVTP